MRKFYRVVFLMNFLLFLRNLCNFESVAQKSDFFGPEKVLSFLDFEDQTIIALHLEKNGIKVPFRAFPHFIIRKKSKTF